MGCNWILSHICGWEGEVRGGGLGWVGPSGVAHRSYKSDAVSL